MPEMLTDAMQKAAKRLNRVHMALGLNGSGLIQAVLIHGRTMEQIGTDRGLSTEPELKYLGRRFREGLDTLAVEYNFAQRL